VLKRVKIIVTCQQVLVEQLSVVKTNHDLSVGKRVVTLVKLKTNTVSQ
jgi:hypothetical protein